MLEDRTDHTNAFSEPNALALPKKIFASTGLSLIEVIGQDAAKLLQGQLTCNINDLSASQASIAGFCNAKGRVISTLLVVKSPASFYLILPADLLDTVLKKLRMYILRADATLQDQTGNMRILGISGFAPEIDAPTGNFAVGQIPVTTIKLPGAARYLTLGTPDQIDEFAGLLSSRYEFEYGCLDEWRYQDISTALPWFDINQSEQHIPQMLGIDQLGGISFSKGCYTGQEIVARSHYLGKVKRALFIAEFEPSARGVVNGCKVLDGISQQSMGCVLANSVWSGIIRALVVLQIVDGLPKNLILDDDYRTPIAIISDQ
ncbi:folate-binding protein YgfZ [Methylomonas sp. EFPC1]|uniref:CAF17-like 4Fe-4S cluster assembly/insertion protein YgfZ n=1 Tax=Methylomonas sp. EFPC1 TaxID=2812647 RepID=UPI0019680D75|nr:folate-binding protein YgfZ [Methylomonas sp. EFPC1]QSB03205.1 folate-binding protein YgfZ [Methylomonas sp. EFPC1]